MGCWKQLSGADCKSPISEFMMDAGEVCGWITVVLH